MPTCQNCIAGYVRKFRPKTEKQKAGWHDEFCETCKGKYLTEPAPIPEQLEKEASVSKDYEEEIPF